MNAYGLIRLTVSRARVVTEDVKVTHKNAQEDVIRLVNSSSSYSVAG
jgi:hypothetical protein